MKESSFKDRRNDKAKERYSPLLKEGKGKGELSTDEPENK